VERLPERVREDDAVVVRPLPAAGEPVAALLALLRRERPAGEVAPE
jgi:hypothetical protein